jgi:hypothetical protein
VPEPEEVVGLPQRERCPNCHDEILRASKKISSKTVIDLEFAKHGCRKTIIKYEGPKGYCRKCKDYYSPMTLDKYGDQIMGNGYPLVFGRGFQSWIIFQRVALRLPYEGVIQAMEEQFSESISQGTLAHIMRSFSGYYLDTENLLLQCILASPFVHVDETKINVQGIDHYVWVFTDGKHVIFRMTETREAKIVHEILKGYKGVLITDFYGGYDSVECKQQKCLVHLIRDLNDDLWAFPFDAEFEMFVLEVKNLIVPILEAVDEHGLTNEYLGKFVSEVDRFFRQAIEDANYHSELTLKYRKRFERYRQSLFAFLNYDSIPWNNNAAERALRHITVQEKISTTFYKSLVPQYLVLLGTMQTCRFQDKSFLKFLLSGQKDIDKFESPKFVRNSRAVGLPSA